MTNHQEQEQLELRCSMKESDRRCTVRLMIEVHVGADGKVELGDLSAMGLGFEGMTTVLQQAADQCAALAIAQAQTDAQTNRP